MKFFIDNILLVFLAIGSGLVLLWPTLTSGLNGVRKLSPAQAVLLMNRQHAKVIDVRELAEFEGGHIAESKHIPLAELSTQAAKLQTLKQKPLIVTCASGMRASKACAELKKQGFADIYELEGGMQAWVQAKLPVTVLKA